MSGPILQHVSLGRSDYRAALALQRRLHARRKAAEIGDLLVLTEHEPVLTIGRGASDRFLRVPLAELERRGIGLVPTEPGGDITYHGPGQLVAYPIVDLRGHGQDLHQYIRRLEETAICLIALYGIRGERRPGTAGVWVGARKIASVGVYVSRWTTMHGIAMNVSTELSAFDLIHPCGMVGMQATSVADMLGSSPSIEEAELDYLGMFATAFGVSLRRADLIEFGEAPVPLPTSAYPH